MLAAAVLMLTTFSSCIDEQGTTYAVMLHEDMLEFVEPTVTYSAGFGTKSEVLTKDNMKDEGMSYLVWQLPYSFHNLEATSMCSLSFRQIKEVPEGDKMYHYLADIEAISNRRIDGSFNFSSSNGLDHVDPSLTCRYVKRDEFAERIEKLVETGVTMTVSVDSKGFVKFTKQPDNN